MGRSSIKERDLGWGRIRREIASMDGAAVTVGLHEEDAGPQDPNAVERGYFNEFGSDNVPARPFMRSTHDTQRLDWIKRMQIDFGRVMDGKLSGRGMLESVGRLATSDIRRAVVNWDTPPNAPRTIAQKGVDDPLVDTGEMLDSIDYQVRR